MQKKNPKLKGNPRIQCETDGACLGKAYPDRVWQYTVCPDRACPSSSDSLCALFLSPQMTSWGFHQEQDPSSPHSHQTPERSEKYISYH